LPQDSSDGVFVEPGGALVEIVEHRVIDELKHQVEMLLATKHFNEIHQVLVAQLLPSHVHSTRVTAILISDILTPFLI